MKSQSAYICYTFVLLVLLSHIRTRHFGAHHTHHAARAYKRKREIRWKADRTYGSTATSPLKIGCVVATMCSPRFNEALHVRALVTAIGYAIEVLRHSRAGFANVDTSQGFCTLTAWPTAHERGMLPTLRGKAIWQNTRRKVANLWSPILHKMG